MARSDTCLKFLNDGLKRENPVQDLYVIDAESVCVHGSSSNCEELVSKLPKFHHYKFVRFNQGDDVVKVLCLTRCLQSGQFRFVVQLPRDGLDIADASVSRYGLMIDGCGVRFDDPASCLVFNKRPTAISVEKEFVIPCRGLSAVSLHSQYFGKVLNCLKVNEVVRWSDSLTVPA